MSFNGYLIDLTLFYLCARIVCGLLCCSLLFLSVCLVLLFHIDLIVRAWLCSLIAFLSVQNCITVRHVRNVSNVSKSIVSLTFSLRMFYNLVIARHVIFVIVTTLFCCFHTIADFA